nr:hypothetical protein [Tanacetum cinerariifolium]
MERAITTDASLVASQDNDNIIKTQTTAMPNVDIPQRIDTGGSPKCQETMGRTPAQTREGRMEHTFELIDTVPPIPYDLPFIGGYTPRSDEDEEEPSLDIEDSPKQGRMIKEIDIDENVNLVNEQGEVHVTAEPLKDDDDATLTETLMNIKRSTAKDKGNGIMQETDLPKKIKKREMIQLSLDEELAQKLHAEELAKETARQE